MSGKPEMQTVMDAALFAAQKHTGQRRKGEAGEPYLNHLVEVAQLVATSPAADADVIAAALLHDVVEDTVVSAEEVERSFGPAVAAYVLEVTDDKRLAAEERKRRQIEHASSLSAGASLIKLGDKISNLRGIRSSPPADWSLERKRAYARWAGEVIAGIRAPDAGLLAEFTRVQTDLLQHLDEQRAG